MKKGSSERGWLLGVLLLLALSFEGCTAQYNLSWMSNVEVVRKLAAAQAADDANIKSHDLPTKEQLNSVRQQVKAKKAIENLTHGFPICDQEGPYQEPVAGLDPLCKAATCDALDVPPTWISCAEKDAFAEMFTRYRSPEKWESRNMVDRVIRDLRIHGDVPWSDIEDACKATGAPCPRPPDSDPCHPFIYIASPVLQPPP